MEIKELGKMKIAGIEQETTIKECMEDNKLPKLWDDFMQRINEIKNKKDEMKSYGVCIQNKEDKTKFRYIAGVEVADETDIPEGMILEDVPASRYASFIHKGKLDKLNDTYADISNNELPRLELKEKDIWLEVYDERFKPDSDESIMEILVSVE